MVHARSDLLVLVGKTRGAFRARVRRGQSTLSVQDVAMSTGTRCALPELKAKPF